MDINSSRKAVFQYIFIGVIAIFLLRLFYLQIVDKTYKHLADENALRKITIYPSRGSMYDRKSKLIVCNQAQYDLMIVPREVKKFDTLLFCQLLEIDKPALLSNLKKAYQTPYKPSVFLKQLPQRVYSRFEENLFNFPGFYSQVRTVRSYLHDCAAHMLGYISEVDDKILKKNKYYRSGDYIGMSGIEQQYEEQLRGIRGSKLVLVDVHNREQGSYNNGAEDTLAVEGENLTLSIDIELQEYGEKLMKNKIGSVVAIEPETGEILAMISSPTYDPNLLNSRERGKNYRKLYLDSMKPLLNRPLMANYPPGSTFKLMVGLVAMQTGSISPQFGYPCSRGYHLGNLTVKCHQHPSAGNISQAILNSCNAYFCQAFRLTVDNNKVGKNVQEGMDVWHDMMCSFGFGHKLGIDLPSEKGCLIPDAKYYNKMHKGTNWHSSAILSLGIGQGEVLATPLQIANEFACIANRGYYYTPHVAKKFMATNDSVLNRFRIKHRTMVDQYWFEQIIDGMEGVVTMGTASNARVSGVPICGKTGTAQNPHGKDHSLFGAFAPKVKPKIAICAIVENSGFGNDWAAPIASLMIEKYLNDTISVARIPMQKRMEEANLLPRKAY
ncbi:MAG: penicillin-binding protein 2 [Bacteroidota bacterium]